MDSIKKYLFQDNTNRYVIGQPPNIPVYIILLSYLGSQIVETGWVHELLSIVLFGAVFTWSYLEIVYGESLLRRALGIVVMTGILIAYIGTL